MEEDKKATRSPHFWTAVGLIFIGTVLLLDNLDVFDFHDLWQLWPLIFVAVGLVKFTQGTPRDRSAGFFWLLFGTLFLLTSLDVLAWHTIWQFWPVLLILLGLSLIYRRGQDGKRWLGASGTETQDRVDVVAIFGGNERRIVSEHFEGGNVTAVCGGTRLDLSQAKLAAGPNVLDIFACCGGAEIIVPEDWHVEIQGTPIFGGFEDNRRHPPVPGAASQTLIIRGTVLFGGLNLKNA